ncbi:MAG: chromosome segregation protein ScpA [Candidatus Nitrosopelagicus sp.]|nr:chromosome segregation protein ScpA [Candidatus Nitrosopelagicus sp.]
MSHETTKAEISKVPISILFDPEGVKKKDIWEIDLIEILSILIKVLEKADKKDLRIAGMAALSSSLIYRMKVENIFALQKTAMENKPIRQRSDIDIQMLDIPYRHESTYPVSLDELLDLLENLIGTIANPRERRSNQLKFEPVDAPDFKKYFNNLENIIGQYQDLILKKLELNGTALLATITKDLNATDSIRCFFAILFLARDEKVDLMQIDDDISITLIQE